MKEHVVEIRVTYGMVSEFVLLLKLFLVLFFFLVLVLDAS